MTTLRLHRLAVADTGIRLRLHRLSVAGDLPTGTRLRLHRLAVVQPGKIQVTAPTASLVPGAVAVVQAVPVGSVGTLTHAWRVAATTNSAPAPALVNATTSVVSFDCPATLLGTVITLGYTSNNGSGPATEQFVNITVLPSAVLVGPNLRPAAWLVNVPIVETLLSVTGGDQQLQLYWTTVPGTTGYQVGIVGQPDITVGPAATNYTFTGLTNGATYTLHVRDMTTGIDKVVYGTPVLP